MKSSKVIDNQCFRSFLISRGANRGGKRQYLQVEEFVIWGAKTFFYKLKRLK